MDCAIDMAAVQGRDDIRRAEGPNRRCIVTRRSGDRAPLIRFVVGPDTVLVPDVDERLPGKGLWLSADPAVLKKALTTNVFAKVARQAVRVPDDLGDRIEALLVQRCIATLGLARRARQAVFGFERVRAWVAAGRAGLLVAASDGAEGPKSKLVRAAGSLGVVQALTARELGAAAGRDHMVHAAVAGGSLAARLRRDAMRLDGLRGTDCSARSAGDREAGRDFDGTRSRGRRHAEACWTTAGSVGTVSQRDRPRPSPTVVPHRPSDDER